MFHAFFEFRRDVVSEQLCTPVQSQTVTLLDTQYRICGKCVQALIPITSAGYAITGVLSVHTAKFSPAALQMWRREPAPRVVHRGEEGQWLHCEHGKVLDLKTEGDSLGRPGGSR
jgi:hypothetical protein